MCDLHTHRAVAHGADTFLACFGAQEAPRSRRATKRRIDEAGDRHGGNEGSMPPPPVFGTSSRAAGEGPGSVAPGNSKRQATSTPYKRNAFGSPDTPKSKIKVRECAPVGPTLISPSGTNLHSF